MADAAAGTAELSVERDERGTVLRVTGPLVLATSGDLWERVPLLEIEGAPPRIDASGVPRCDSAGAALLAHLRDQVGATEISGANEQVAFMLEVIGRPCATPPEQPPQAHSQGVIDALGGFARESLDNVRATTEYVGSLGAGLAWAVARPGRLRWRETRTYMAATGANALGIVALVNLLMGVILAFQMAAQMRAYGADLYVADIVGLSIVVELGPLMTAIIVAGRSGSAFAAEIGTMTVNEEVSALDTMGLERTRFLVMPKVVALLLMMPLLLVYADLCGIFGGMLIGVTFLDQPASVYIEHTLDRIELWDIGKGFIKGQSYAVVIAAVGCLRGLQTRHGAQGVGRSATSAVVSAIFLIICVDAVLTVIFYILD